MIPLHEDPVVLELLRKELAQDIGSGDVTTMALVPQDAQASGRIIAKCSGILAGGSLGGQVFHLLDEKVKVCVLLEDGAPLKPGDVILTIQGPARALLSGERTALNIMQRLTGIASLTAEYVRRAGDTEVDILDTRKTTPGLRRLEKYAVACGKGTNHRMGLHDQVMIKDNHLAFWKQSHDGENRTIPEAVAAARTAFPGLEVEVEVDTVDQLKEALEGNPDWVLLDNMTPDQLKECVRITAGRAKLEASGGINLDTIAAVAASGVDAISVGALTHSAKAADLSLELDAPA